MLSIRKFILVFVCVIYGTGLQAESNGLLRLPEMSPAEMAISNFDIRAAADPRIVGGFPADIKDSPWQVALIFAMYQDPFRAQFCGGSIISPKWILTAAHCVVNEQISVSPSKLDVVANTTFYGTGGDRIKVKSIYYHPNYRPTNDDYDVALLRIEETNKPLKPIQLASKNQTVHPETTLLVTGWGAIKEGSLGTPYLMGANIPVVSSPDCKVAYGDEVTERMICAGLRKGGLDSCQGDSGGPAALRDPSGDPAIILGIVSHGAGCARREKYGVYTDVRAVRDWLDSQMASVP